MSDVKPPPPRDPIGQILGADPGGPKPVNPRSATSQKAYQQITDLGLLSKRRLQAYTTFYLNGALTRNELNEEAKRAYRTRAQFDKRLAELERMGVLAKVGERECTVTGYTCDLWDVNDRLPVMPADATPTDKPPLPRPSKVDLRAATSQLRRLMQGKPPLALEPDKVPSDWRMSADQMPLELVKVCRWIASLAGDLRDD